MSETVLWVLAGLTANTIIGAAVWASVDDNERRLLAWYRSCPVRASAWAQPLVLNAWPVALWLWWRENG